MDADPCELCGATGTYDEDGNIFCSNGHFQHRAAAEVDDETGRHGKVVRKKVEKKKERVSRVFKGRKAYKLFLQAWQYVLWKQCYALVHVHGLPLELWDVVRDLWELRVSKLTHRYEDVAKTVDETQSASDISESDTEVTDTEAEEQEPQQQMKRAKKASDSPTLIDVAALNYLGILILRYPLTLKTLFTWLETESIPFIRAIRHVPKEMKDRLPAEYHEALDTTSLLKQQDLQLAVSRMAAMYTSTFGITIPPLNYHLLLLSYIEFLALPIQIYKTVRYLNTILNNSFTYPSSQTTRLSSTSFPETQLMTLIIIATKIFFPFNNIKHYLHDHSSPCTLRLNWQSWLAAKQAYDAALTSQFTPLRPGTELPLTDKDVMRMTPEQLDAYMDYYQRTFTSDRSGTEGVAGKILDLFPLETLAESSTADLALEAKQRSERVQALRSERVKAVQSSLRSQRVISEQDEAGMLESEQISHALPRPGSSYQIFRTVFELGTDTPARVFHKEAASLACTTVEALVRAVRSAEEVIERWRRGKRREERFGAEQKGMDMEDGGSAVEDVDIEMEE